MIHSLALLGAPAAAHVPVVYETSAGEDWCGVIDAALGGDIILLAPGVYTGPCAIEGKVSDPVGESTLVQSMDPTDPAVLVAGPANHVLSLSGVRVVLLQLRFADLPVGVDAVHVGNADDMWVRYSTFENVAGSAVRQVEDIADLTVENNELFGVGSLVDLGCADGTCAAGTVLVEDNLVVGAADGVAFRSAATGTVRDNVLVDLTGVAITTNGGDAVLEGNLVESSGTAIEILAGPALLRSQILLAPIGVVAPGATGGVRIVGNTIVASGGAPLVLDGWGPDLGLRLADNAIDAPVPDVGGASSTSNVACVPADLCFTNVAVWDFYPSPDGPLRDGAGTPDPELLSDWCGMPRQDPPTPGAMEAFGEDSYGGIAGVAFKDAFTCTIGEEDPPGTDGTPPPPVNDPPLGGDDLVIDTCGCAAPPAGSVAPWMALALGAAIRALRKTSGSVRGARNAARARLPSEAMALSCRSEVTTPSRMVRAPKRAVCCEAGPKTRRRT